MDFGLRTTGVKEVIANLKKTAIKVEVMTRGQLIEAGFAVMRDAIRITPIDLGNLRASAYVWWPQKGEVTRVPKVDAIFKEDHDGQLAIDRQTIISQLSVQFEQMPVFVVVVGFTAYYSIYVHENMTAHHDVGAAKFLELALQSAIPRVVSNLQKVRI